MKRVLRASLLSLIVLSGGLVRADVGIVVYESKGVDARRTSSGHVALIATNLCAEGIDQVRTCQPAEEPGVVVTRYANLASGYDRSVFVVPIRDHFMATRDTRLIPTLSSGGTLNAMQIEYWREHLRPYLPPLSQQQYQEMRDELDRFDMGRSFRRLISLEILIGALGPHKKSPTEPIAIVDPSTQELVPNGRWREAIGAAHMRSSMLITAPTTAEQEAQLIDFIPAVNKQPFQALADNCSDFVERALLKVFADSGLRFRPRIAHVADAWVTSPLAVATDFLSYAQRERVPITVTLVPMLAGTRRPTAKITSLSRGSLVPSPSQGKMAFGMKIYFNTLNPLLGITAYSVDKLSRFADLERLVHERGGGDLSRIAADIKGNPHASEEERKAWRREQVRVFGTTSCWKAKQGEFVTLTKQAHEAGLLTTDERKLILKPGRPYLLPRLYERAAAQQQHEGALLAGMQSQGLPASIVSHFLPPAAPPLQEALVPGREEIREMASSDQADKQLLAFKLMTSVINYDLSSEPIRRRTTAAFDPDWELFLEVAQKNALHLPDSGPLSEPLAACSCREFDQGKSKQDAFGESRGSWQRLMRESRDALFGPSR